MDDEFMEYLRSEEFAKAENEVKNILNPALAQVPQSREHTLAALVHLLYLCYQILEAQPASVRLYWTKRLLIIAEMLAKPDKPN